MNETLLVAVFKAPLFGCSDPFLKHTPAITLTLSCRWVDIRDLLIWQIIKFFYCHQILGLIYPIIAYAHGIFAFTCMEITPLVSIRGVNA